MSEYEKFDIFNPNYFYEALTSTGRTIKLATREEMNKYALNPENPIPELVGEKTWFSNYVLTYWMPLMGVHAFAIYSQLVKMSYGKKNHAFPTVPYIAMMTGLNERTVQKHMRTLQDLNFVVVILVKDSRTNRNKPNLYLLSRTIPFLEKKDLERLPKRLQEEHERFIDKTKNRIVFEDEDEEF